MGTINEPSGSTREVAQGTDSHESTTTERRTADRRSLIRNATLAAGGVVAANVARARPAAANDPNDITLSSSKTTAWLTGATTTHVGSGAGFMFQTGRVWAPGSSAYGCALAGWANVPSKPHGVYGWTDQAGYALIGYGSASTSTGAMFHCGRANVFLQPSGASPASRSDAHSTGEFIEDSAGNLWVCVGSGSPGRWRKLAGSATAGAYHALTPGRAYDSRLAVPGPQGPIGPGANRTISVAHSRNPSTGAESRATSCRRGDRGVHQLHHRLHGRRGLPHRESGWHDLDRRLGDQLELHRAGRRQRPRRGAQRLAAADHRLWQRWPGALHRRRHGLLPLTD